MSTLSPEAQKLIDVLGELAEVNREGAAHLRATREAIFKYQGNCIQSIHDMVAGIVPCAAVVRITETQCVACEGVPTRKCDVCGDDLCDDCRIDHNHGER